MIDFYVMFRTAINVLILLPLSLLNWYFFVESYKYSLIMCTPSSSNLLGIEFLLFTLSRFFGKQDTLLTSVAVFCTFFWRFCYWLWTSNCLLEYEMISEYNRKQVYVDVSLIELIIIFIWFWFRNCLSFFNGKNGLCIGIWKDIDL